MLNLTMKGEKKKPEKGKETIAAIRIQLSLQFVTCIFKLGQRKWQYMDSMTCLGY